MLSRQLRICQTVTGHAIGRHIKNHRRPYHPRIRSGLCSFCFVLWGFCCSFCTWAPKIIMNAYPFRRGTMATFARGAAYRLQLFAFLDDCIMAGGTGFGFFHPLFANSLYNFLGDFVFMDLLEGGEVFCAFPNFRRRLMALSAFIRSDIIRLRVRGIESYGNKYCKRKQKTFHRPHDLHFCLSRPSHNRRITLTDQLVEIQFRCHRPFLSSLKMGHHI